MNRTLRILPVLALLLAVGCGDDGETTPMDGGSLDGGTSGDSLSVTLEAEETIVDGIAAGTGDEDILDGWSVDFAKYIVVIGEVHLTLATDDTVGAEDEAIYAIDLTQAGPTGFPGLWNFSDLAIDTYNIGYHIAEADADTIRDETVSTDDYDTLVAGGLTYLIEGTLSKTDGESCDPDGTGCSANPSIAFTIAAPAATAFGPCQAEDGVEGVTIIEGGTTTTLTLHGDHLFFNGFPEGEESSVARYGQWFANADSDRDGEVTQAELEAIFVSDMAELDDRYDLADPPGDLTLSTLWDYVRAQLMTQGHYQGEGECAINGEAHEH